MAMLGLLADIVLLLVILGLSFLLLVLGVFTREQRGEMCLHRLAGLHRKARRQRIQVGIGVDLRTINVEFFAPDQLLLLALLNDRLKAAAKDLHSIALPNTGQARMVG